ncbi:MAG: ABC transporter ATP-binding protein [Dehalococcoidia bacterium]
MKHLLRLVPYMTRYKGLVFLGWACVIGSALAVMFSPLLVRFAVNNGLRPVHEGDTLVLHGNASLLVWTSLLIVVVAIARGLTQFGMTFVGESLGQRISYDIRNEIYDHMQRLSYAYHDQMETGQIMSRATQDVENMRMFYAQALFRTIYIALMVSVGLIGMVVVNWQLALVSMVTMPFIIWRSVVFQARVRPLWWDIQQSQAELTQIADEGLNGIRVVKAFSQEPFEAEKFRIAAQKQAALNLRQAMQMAQNTPLLQGLGMAQIALTTGAGALLIARGQLTAGDLIAFALWLNTLQLPLRTIGMMVNAIARCMSSAERVFELMDAESAVEDAPGARELANVQGHVRFDHVGFGYDGTDSTLSDINIDAAPGTVIALLGPAGSGKSTLVNLLPRFYDVTSGAITIDGNDLREVTLESLRRNIGIVQQDLFLFIGTIGDNIAYGRPGATQQEIEAAAQAARIHDFIMSLPEGYNEWVGERASRSRAARSSASRSRARCSSTRAFSSSTTPPRAWTRRPSS